MMRAKPVLSLALFYGLAAALPAAEFSQDAPDLTALVGQKVDVQLTTGKQLVGVEVVKAVAGTGAGAVRSLTVKEAKPPRQHALAASMIVEISVASQPLDVTFDKQSRELSHDPAKRATRLAHAEQVKRQLAAKRGRFWEEIPSEEQAAYVADEKKFLQEVSSKMRLAMELIETDYFLFYTDMPRQSVGVYVDYLDSMYVELSKAFNFPSGKNIWRGKCVVVAFAEKKSFQQFEQQVLGKPDPQGNQGICHSFSSGRVVISCYKGNSTTFFATVLVHETAHGFVHRYKTSIFVPAWMNEGIADWVAGTVVRADTEVRRRQQDAIGRLRSGGSLNGLFTAKDLETWQYGAASSLVELLLRIDPKKYRLLIDGVKEGLDSEEALRQAYGMSFVELAQRYGQLANVPNVQP